MAGAVLGVTVFALVALLFIWNLIGDVRAEVLLDRDAVPASATVMQVHKPSKGPARAQVTFSAEGTPRTAWVQLGMFQDGPGVGGRLDVEYTPQDPSMARLAGSHELLSFPWTLFMLLAGLGVAFRLLAPHQAWFERAWFAWPLRRKRPHRH